MSKRIVVQRPVRTADEGGGSEISWEDAATTWAAVTPVSGKEEIVRGRLKGEVTQKVTVRYRAGMSSEMRLLYDGRILDVKAVIDPEEKHRFLEIYCLER